jgi:4-amino-4-deoxy-L-arabinose transferase-like glycosyltransferase
VTVVDLELELPRAPEPVRRWTAGWRLALLFTGLALLTHLPGLMRPGVLNPDEGFLATQAQVLNHGGHLYQDVVDRKPPLVPLIYSWTFRVTGSDALWSVRLLAIAAHVITALLLAAIARRRWSSAAGVAAGVLYLVASAGFVPADGQAANFEVFMLPLTCLAVWWAMRDRLGAAGAAVGLATLAKQVAGVTLLPVLWIAWQRDRRRGAGQVVTGFVLPVAFAAFAYGVSDFVFWVFTDSNGYLDPSGSALVALRRVVTWTALFVAANLGAALLLPLAWRNRRENIDLWLWLVGAAIGVSAGLRFFGHYYLQLAPPLVLLATGALHRAKTTVWMRTATLGAASLVVFIGLALTTQPEILRPYGRLAEQIDVRTSASDSIFVWGELPQLYWASDRQPASRFITTGFLTGYSGGRAHVRIGEQYAVDGAWDDLFADFRAHPPALIIDASQGTPYGFQRFPTFARYLQEHYEPATIVDGAIIWARRTEG